MRIFFVGEIKKKWLEDMESNSGFGFSFDAIPRCGRFVLCNTGAIAGTIGTFFTF